MKRSQMVEIMSGIMQANFDFDNGSWCSDAEKLLTLIEKLGMLPPSYMFCATGDYVTSKEVIKIFDESYDGKFCWEDEDA